MGERASGLAGRGPGGAERSARIERGAGAPARPAGAERSPPRPPAGFLPPPVSLPSPLSRICSTATLRPTRGARGGTLPPAMQNHLPSHRADGRRAPLFMIQSPRVCAAPQRGGAPPTRGDWASDEQTGGSGPHRHDPPAPAGRRRATTPTEPEARRAATCHDHRADGRRAHPTGGLRGGDKPTRNPGGATGGRQAPPQLGGGKAAGRAGLGGERGGLPPRRASATPPASRRKDTGGFVLSRTFGHLNR